MIGQASLRDLPATYVIDGKGNVWVTTRVEGAEAVITIRDDGVGIPPEKLPRIFDPFFTTKDVGQGTGLGLSIVHGIVTSHGGTVTATSTLGEGATFAVRLPIGG